MQFLVRDSCDFHICQITELFNEIQCLKRSVWLTFQSLSNNGTNGNYPNTSEISISIQCEVWQKFLLFVAGKGAMLAPFKKDKSIWVKKMINYLKGPFKPFERSSFLYFQKQEKIQGVLSSMKKIWMLQILYCFSSKNIVQILYSFPNQNDGWIETHAF